MQETISIFGMQIPVVVFTTGVSLISALIAAGIALLVNYMSNRQQTERLKLQLQHEAGQNNRDREMALRRDVYLEAASEMANAVRYIAKFGDINLPFAEHEAIAKNYGAALNKVHMVAGMEVLAKVIEASDTFAHINLELNQLRFSLLLDQKNIAFLQKSVEDDIAQQKNLVTRIGQLQAVNPNHPDISALATTFQELESRIQKSRQRHSELNSKTITDHFNLSSIVFKRTLSFGEKVIEVNIALRKELEFDFKGNEDDYKILVRRSQEQAIGEMDKYITEIGRLLEEKKKALQFS